MTACHVAEAGRAVVLVEEGPRLPLDPCPPFSRTEMVQKYRAGGVTAAIGNPKVAYVESRCVGDPALVGENQAVAAADSFGRVHGIPNLRHGDASLLPSAPSVSPQGSIMAFVRRNALAFLR